MRNSLYNDGILDSTESFETFVNMGENIQLQKIVAFRGYLNPNNGSTVLPSGLELEYIYWLYLKPNVISWIDNSNDGITFLLLKNNTFTMDEKMKNTSFLFFDVISTNSVGKITLYGRSLEVCEGDINSYKENNRSEITWNWLNEWKGLLLYQIPPNFFNIKSINSGKPWGLTIGINNNKRAFYPTCDSSMELCYNGGEVTQGYCYDPQTNTQYSTYTIPEYDKVFNPTMVKNGINYWLRQSGRAWCNAAPVSQSNNPVKNTNNVVGMGVSNLQQGIDSMSRNSRNLRNKIVNLQAKIDSQKVNLNGRLSELDDSRTMIQKNADFIKQKMDILDSRNRQLQLSIDKNIYNKKIVYVLLAVAIAVIVLILFGVSFVKNMGRN